MAQFFEADPVLPPSPDGVPFDPGGNTGDGGGGGSPAAPPNLANLPVTGGLVGISTQILAPGFDYISGQNLMYVINPDDNNCEEVVEYDCKVEEFELGNEATIHRVAIRYRDLGVVTFTLTIQSVTLTSIDTTLGTGNAQLIKIGGNGPNGLPTNKIHTFLASLKVTTEAPQVKIFMNPSAGPLCITMIRAYASYGDGDML